MSYRAITLTATAAVITASVLWQSQQPPTQRINANTQTLPTAIHIPSSAQVVSTAVDNTLDSPLPDRGAFAEFERQRPGYLRGTDLRGQLQTTEHGDLLLSVDIRQRFDYFFLMHGDIAQHKLQAIIRDHLRQSLSQPARQQALQQFSNYVDYLNAYHEFQQGLDFGNMHQPAQWAADEIKSLRREYLGDAVAEAYFAEEEALRDRYLQRQLDDSATVLSDAQQQTLGPMQLREKTAQLKSTNASPAEIQLLREHSYGIEAAERLAALDQSRQNWLRKQQQFQQLKHDWQQVDGLSPGDMDDGFQQQAMSELELSDADFRRLLAIES